MVEGATLIRLLLFLALVSTALAAPRPVELPLPTKPEEAITKSQIIATLQHMQQIAREQGAELDAAKAEVATLGKQLDGALVDIGVAAQETWIVQATLDGDRKARIDAESARDTEKKGRLAAEAHVRTIKNWLAIALAAVLVLLVQQLPFGLLVPPAGIYARVGASVAAAGLAWIIVARFV